MRARVTACVGVTGCVSAPDPEWNRPSAHSRGVGDMHESTDHTDSGAAAIGDMSSEL